MGFDYDKWDLVIMFFFLVILPALLLRVFGYYIFLKDKVKINHLEFTLNEKRIIFNFERFYASIISSFCGPLIVATLLLLLGFIKPVKLSTDSFAFILGPIMLIVMVIIEAYLLKKLMLKEEGFILLYFKTAIVTVFGFMIVAVIMLNLFHII